MKIKPILCAFGCLFPAALLGKLGDRTGIFCKDGLKLTSCAEVFVYPKAGHHSSIPCFKNLTPLMGPLQIFIKFPGIFSSVSLHGLKKQAN